MKVRRYMSRAKVCAECHLNEAKKTVRNRFLTGKMKKNQNYLMMILLDFSVLPLMTRL